MANSPFTIFAVVSVKEPKSTLIEPEKVYALFQTKTGAAEFVDDNYSIDVADLGIIPWVVN